MARRYELTEAADRDLVDIYQFSFRKFGEVRADAYFESLEDCLGRLAETPELGRDASKIRKGYRCFVHRRHAIYYQSMRAGILVVRVLGPGMSIEGNLA